MYSEKTPDDGQRNCPKRVEFYSKNKFEKLVHLVGFFLYKNVSLYSSKRQVMLVKLINRMLDSTVLRPTLISHASSRRIPIALVIEVTIMLSHLIFLTFTSGVLPLSVYM